MAECVPPILPANDGNTGVQDDRGLYVGARLKVAARLEVVADPMRKAWRGSRERGARIRGENEEKVEGRQSQCDVVNAWRAARRFAAWPERYMLSCLVHLTRQASKIPWRQSSVGWNRPKVDVRASRFAGRTMSRSEID
jgi:hypothetical protein